MTTNYDNVIEIYSRINTNPQSKYYLEYRGFTLDGDIFKFGLHKDPQKVIHYLKLHGSLDWWIDNNNEITINEIGKSYGQSLGNRLMIYPVYEKDISEFPFYYLYSTFRYNLRNEKVVIVVGYSFRDLSINNAFKNRFFVDDFTENKGFFLIICPKSDDIQKRINVIYEDYLDRIYFIDSKFGEDKFIKKIESVITTNV